MSKIKMFFDNIKKEDEVLKSIEYKVNSKRNAILVALGITLFFLLPFIFMIHNLLFLGNYDIIKVLGIFVMLIIFLLPRFIYLDVLKYYNEELKKFNFKAGHIMYFMCSLLVIILLFIVL